MKNLSDGKSDGFVLFYVHSGEVLPVALTQEQVDTLEISVALIPGAVKVISGQSQGKITDLLNKSTT